MTYQVLARKWRPGSFREMVGQQHVLRALINALDHDRLHHAYLFTGTRGVGKTTVARILAKCLNCDSGVSSEPCGSCASCREISEGRSIDLIEVDAASRTKVEDTRELLDNVQYAPTRSRYKIYLIDEVHMLSNHSFNALLKTLEEPPPHAKFLLATTDPQKLPATVLSRCLQFNLKNMVPEQIVEHLAHILGQESIDFDRNALGFLARGAEGSMRDALSLTDQAIAFGSGKLREAEVRDMLGTVDRGRVLALVEALLTGEPAPVLALIAAIAEHAPDYAATLDELISTFHQMTIAQMVPQAIDPSWSEHARVSELAGKASVDDTQLFYQFAINGRRDLAVAPDPRIALEMTLLRMIAFRPATVVSSDTTGTHATGVDRGASPAKKPEPPASPVARSNRIEVSPSDLNIQTSAASISLVNTKISAADQAKAIPAHEPASVPLPSAATPMRSPEKAFDVANDDMPTPGSWPMFFETLGLVGITENIALHCELVRVEGRSLFFVLDANNANFFNDSQPEKMQVALNSLLVEPVTVSIELGAVGETTPAALRARLAAERLASAESAIAADPVLAALLADFDAIIIPGSIRPRSTN